MASPLLPVLLRHAQRVEVGASYVKQEMRGREKEAAGLPAAGDFGIPTTRRDVQPAPAKRPMEVGSPTPTPQLPEDMLRGKLCQAVLSPREGV